jgi:hypothetical protein
MSKKLRSFFAIAVILTIIASVNILGAQSKPNSWAEIEVKEAITNDLVHEVLRSDYQTPIKRYEYVLLALDILDKSGIDVTIKQEYVFDDIIGHSYEKEILKAYHAGVIDGYGNGLFKPNANISREEVATLIVKLLKKIDFDKNTTINGNIKCSDSLSISSWAMDSVKYCYANNIIKGVGKDKKGLDILKPLGTATREESILLVYRLAKVEKVISDVVFGTITIDQNTTKISTINEAGDVFDLTYFARQFTDKTATEILGLDAVNDASIIDITNKSSVIVVDDGTVIYLVKYDDGIGLDLYSIGAVSARATQIYTELLMTINQNDVVLDSVQEGITALNLNKTNKDEDIADRYNILMRTDDIEVDNSYIVKYYEKLN